MTESSIFLGSGASVTFVPEIDLYIKPNSLNGNKDTLTIHSDFTNNFSLVNNLYVGCILEFYDNGSLTTTHRITENTATTIKFQPAQTISLSANDDYYRIKGYGAPCPAEKTTGSGNTYVAQVITVEFESNTLSDYDDDDFSFGQVPTADGTTSTSFVIGLNQTSTYGGATATVEVDISDADLDSGADVVNAIINALDSHTQSTIHFTYSGSGNVLTITNTYGGIVGQTPATNDATNITINTTTAGSTTANVEVKRLNADNWLGIVESLTFPQLEVETKRQNLFVGGTRNMTYQYKGIETAGNGSLNFVANHGAWLYYFFGKCSSISATLSASTNPTSDFAGNTASENKYYLENTTFTDTGPLFYRSIDNVMTPPVLRGQDAFGDLDQLTEPSGTSSISNAITYTFTEQDGDDMPSFALEQVMSKLPSSNTYRTNNANDNEDTNFVLIATGNRVNTLTMTANENEEVKITLDCIPKKIHNLEKTELYEARNGVTDETSFKNYSSIDEFRQPFFFSSGSISIFGEQFLRITNLTLTMNNTLQQKRFVGIGNKGIQEAIPSQREYEISLTALVTDDRLFNELKNENLTSGTLIDLIFDKSNGEQIRLKFDDYMVTTNTWTIPEDKGAITVEATIVPLSLNSCTVTTHWILQG